MSLTWDTTCARGSDMPTQHPIDATDSDVCIMRDGTGAHRGGTVCRAKGRADGWSGASGAAGVAGTAGAAASGCGGFCRKMNTSGNIVASANTPYQNAV